MAVRPANLAMAFSLDRGQTLGQCGRARQRMVGAMETVPMTEDVLDRLAIRELVENWAVWRDARMWDRFRTVWHSDGRMWATWFQGSFEEFIKANQDGWARGVRILHFLGGSVIEVVVQRAVAQT